MLTKGSPSTRLATLQFLAQQAFFAPGPETQVCSVQSQHLLHLCCVLIKALDMR